MVSLRSHPVLAIALGVLLLANPLYVGHLHLDDPNWYRYESAEVTYDEDGFDVPVGAISNGLDDDIACLRNDIPTRACAFEHAVHENGTITVPVEWGENFIRTHGLYGYEFAYVEGSFYEVEAREVGDGIVLSLNRTPADEAMREVATPISDADAPIQRAIRTGSVKTYQQLDGANQLLRDGDTYYVVYEVASHFQASNILGRLLETILIVLGMGVGLFLVLRGQRRRIEGEWRE